MERERERERERGMEGVRARARERERGAGGCGEGRIRRSDFDLRGENLSPVSAEGGRAERITRAHAATRSRRMLRAGADMHLSTACTGAHCPPTRMEGGLPWIGKEKSGGSVRSGKAGWGDCAGDRNSKSPGRLPVNYI